jgi:hypothetical protein
MGSATLRQKVLPLDRALERFGQFTIQGPNRYDVVGVTVGDAAADDWGVVTDHFAPGDFENLNETDKLSRPSFEDMDAGVRVGSDFVDGPLAAMKVAKLDYETSIIDTAWSSRRLGRFVLDRALQLFTVMRSSKALSVAASTGPSKFAAVVREAPAVTLATEEYAVASVDTLAPRVDVADGVTKGAALLALKESREADLQVVPAYELEGV